MAASAQPTEPPTPRVLRVLLDTNVILDWLLDGAPWADEALPLWQSRDAGLLLAYVPASVLTDIFYIARRQVEAAALAGIDRSLALEVIPVGDMLPGPEGRGFSRPAGKRHRASAPPATGTA